MERDCTFDLPPSPSTDSSDFKSPDDPTGSAKHFCQLKHDSHSMHVWTEAEDENFIALVE